MNRKHGFGTGRVLGLAATAFFVVSSSACATINYDATTLQAVAAMNRVAPPASYERVGDFEVSQRPVFVIAQLLTVVDADLEDALQRQLQRNAGDAVLNLRTHEEYDVIDALIGIAQAALLFGANIVQTRSVSIRGDVVRWNTGFMESDAGATWLAENCRSTEVETETGTRPAHLCFAPDADASEETAQRLGLLD